MKKTIRFLYVDPLSPPGHINFNNIYISALSAIPNINIDFCFQEGYIKKLTIPTDRVNNIYHFEKPRRIFHGKINKALWRFHQLKVLFYCKRLNQKYKYSYIFISSFDEISLLLSGLMKKNVMAVCHANAEHIANSKVSKFFHAKLSKKGNLLTLNKALSDFMEKEGIYNTYSPHGFPSVDCDGVANGRFIFIPVQPNMVDAKFLKELLNNRFSDLLKELNVKLILKDNPALPHNLPNIVFTDKKLSKSDYDTFFKTSGLIILPYRAEKYNYRTSAMLMESISYEKNVAVPKAKSFLSLYCPGDKGIWFYDGVEDIISIINNIFATNTIPYTDYTNMMLQNKTDIITNTILAIIYGK